MELLSLDKLCDLVREVRPILFDRVLAGEIHEKGAADFVTHADTSIQNFIRERLTELCPDYNFMGEEGSEHEIDPSVPTFVLDPIDGTTNFIYDMHLSAVSLALILDGEPLKAVVYNPFTDEMFSAEKGHGAYLNGRPLHVSSTAELSHALIDIGTTPYEKHISGEYFGLFREMFLRSADIRRLGSAALAGCYVAAGRTDCCFEDRLSPWDFAAALLIICEAGGSATDWDGKTIRLTAEKSSAVFSNGKIHSEILDIINEYR